MATLLRTEDEAECAVDRLNQQPDEHVVRFIQRQSEHDMSQIVTDCVNTDECEDFLADLDEKGFTVGPRPSKEFLIREGQTFTMMLSQLGNIRRTGFGKDTADGAIDFIYHSKIKCSGVNFSVEPDDITDQSSVDFYFGHNEIYSQDNFGKTEKIYEFKLKLPKVRKERGQNEGESTNPDSKWRSFLYFVKEETGQNKRLSCVFRAYTGLLESHITVAVVPREENSIEPGEELASSVLDITWQNGQLQYPYPARLALPSLVGKQSNYTFVKVCVDASHEWMPVSSEEVNIGRYEDLIEFEQLDLIEFELPSFTRIRAAIFGTAENESKKVIQTNEGGTVGSSVDQPQITIDFPKDDLEAPTEIPASVTLETHMPEKVQFHVNFHGDALVERFFRLTSRCLEGDEWTNLASRLKMNKIRIARIGKANSGRSSEDTVYAMLCDWYKTTEVLGNKVENLCRALRKINREELANFIEQDNYNEVLERRRITSKGRQSSLVPQTPTR